MVLYSRFLKKSWPDCVKTHIYSVFTFPKKNIKIQINISTLSSENISVHLTLSNRNILRVLKGLNSKKETNQKT